MMKAMGKRIAVDMDEVLFPMITRMNKYYEKKYQKPAPKKLPNVYDYSAHFNISKKASQLFVYDFYDTSFAYATEPLDASVEAMQSLAKTNTLYILTGRQTYNQCKLVTQYLIQKYFDNIFSDIIYTNSYSLVGDEVPKSTMCKLLAADYLIDDSVYNCNECKNADTNGILYGTYPWNIENEDLSRINSWREKNFQHLF